MNELENIVLRCNEKDFLSGARKDFSTHRSVWVESPSLARSTLFVWALIFCLSFASLAAENPLTVLYRNFLNNGNNPCVVSFEREMLVPKRESGEKQIMLKDGRTALMQSFDKDYILFIRAGEYFLIAYSSKNPIVQEEKLMSAEELNGFDGESYWTMQLNNPIKVHFADTNVDESLISSLQFNPLTIIPLKEAQRNQGKYMSDIHLATIKGLAADCLSVVQFGLTYELTSNPRLNGRELISKGRDNNTLLAELGGNTKIPVVIDYKEFPDGNKLVALLDYDHQALTIRRSFASKIYFEARYSIRIAKTNSNIQTKSAFSWQPYKNHLGNVIGMVLSNGATIQVTTNPGPLSLGYIGHVVDKARPVQSRSRTPIYGLFACVTAIGLLFIFHSAKIHKKT